MVLVTRALARSTAFALALVVSLAFGLPGPVRADAPAAAAPASAATDYAAAQSLFKARKYRETVTALDAFIPAHPRDARAYVLRGDAKAELGDDDGALADYNAAIGIDPDFEYAYVTRCETRLDVGNVEGALSDCDVALRLSPDDGQAFKDRADVYFEADSYPEALADYDKAVALGDTTPSVYAARCDTNRLLHKDAAAKSDCERALTIDPKNRRGLWARGRLALTEARYTDGIADFNAYISQDPKGSDLGYYFRGFAYNRVQSWRNALEDLQTYLQRRPSDPDGYRERAIARSELADKAGALADLSAALTGYRRDGDTDDAARVAAMAKALNEGQPLTPP
jgi:tetratricopeptide (TPR) repeat protein